MIRSISAKEKGRLQKKTEHVPSSNPTKALVSARLAVVATLDLVNGPEVAGPELLDHEVPRPNPVVSRGGPAGGQTVPTIGR